LAAVLSKRFATKTFLKVGPSKNAAAFEGRVYTNKPTLLSPAALGRMYRTPFKKRVDGGAWCQADGAASTRCTTLVPTPMVRPIFNMPMPSAFSARMRASTAGLTRRRPIHWPQQCVRAAHEAMLKSRSHDLLRLARLALEAAIRTESDLIELLNDVPKPKPPAGAVAHA
jgi:hypothetical protein